MGQRLCPIPSVLQSRLDRNMALRIDESADKIPETFRGMALVAKTSSPNPIFFGIICCLPS